MSRWSRRNAKAVSWAGTRAAAPWKWWTAIADSGEVARAAAEVSAGGGAALSQRGAGGRVDGDAAHRGQVEHQPAVAQRAPGPVVPAAAHRQRQAVRAGGADGRGDVLGVFAAGDQRGAVIDRAVPDLPRGIIRRVSGGQHSAAQRRA